ncbi:MAG: UMP kinase [Candidatus Pacearchaeota archaeon]
MEKKVIVLSLGGSMIVPDKINNEFLNKFKKVLEKNKNKYKFVVVCGGGSIARTYIHGLDNENIKNKEYFQSLLGISVTRLNARFLTYFFGKDANQGIPHDMKEIESMLKFNDFVFCGALRYAKKQTSDSTSAKLAHYFNSDFINLTNVNGLYDKNPKKFKSAKFIPEINHKDFLKIANQIKFKPGQNFVLDQTAAKIIKKHNITTYILGPDIENLDKVLNNKYFIGSRIKG